MEQSTIDQIDKPKDERLYPKLTSQFELIYTFGILWLLSGAFADGWSHANIPELEKVFSLAHITLYTGAAFLSLFIIYNAVTNFAMGFPIKRLLPFGYGNALPGTILFGLSGPADLVWHSLFGIEQNIEATFSPTHFGAMVGIILIFSAPLVSKIKGTPIGTPTEFLDEIPAIVSATAVLSIFSLVTIWAHPFTKLFPADNLNSISRDLNQGYGVISIILQTIFLMSLILYLINLDTLPKFSYTVILTIHGTLIQIIEYNFYLIPVMIIIGIVIDLWVDRFNPKGNTTSFRIFAFLIPSIMYSMYFLLVSLFEDMWWEIHTWSGSIFIAGIFGILVSYLVKPISFEGEK